MSQATKPFCYSVLSILIKRLKRVGIKWFVFGNNLWLVDLRYTVTHCGQTLRLLTCSDTPPLCNDNYGKCFYVHSYASFLLKSLLQIKITSGATSLRSC